MIFRYVLCSTLGFLCCHLQANAATITLNNGDRISGEIEHISNDFIALKTQFGSLEIPKSTIQLVDGDQDAAAEMVKAVAPPQSSPTPETPVAAIEPSAGKDSRDYEWTGRIALGGNLEDGNTHKKALTFDSETQARNEKNRFILGGDVNWASDEGEETENDQELYGEYDRFQNEKWFIGGRTRFTIDKIAALDLRQRYGLVTGYQFYEEERINLKAQVGSEYIREEFTNSGTEDDIAGTWGFDYDQKLFDNAIKIFHNHDLSVPLDDTDGFLFISETGIRVPIGEYLTGTAQVEFDWDNQPAQNVREDDTTYSFTIGYEW